MRDKRSGPEGPDNEKGKLEASAGKPDPVGRAFQGEVPVAVAPAEIRSASQRLRPRLKRVASGLLSLLAPQSQ